MAENVWVVVHNDGWAVKRANAKAASRVFPTQAQAISYGRSLAQIDQVELFIQGQDGRIRDRSSYGNDPYPPKG